MRSEKSFFTSEAELCRTFIAQLPMGWTAYPETGGFDILLSREADGAQVGIEAKLTLNAKVIEQIVPGDSWWQVTESMPDYRAILVPMGCAGGLMSICRMIDITVIEMASREFYFAASKVTRKKMKPELPTLNAEYWKNSYWRDWCPTKRVDLPDYIPDVSAGVSAPVALTAWKVKAIKLVILLDRRGFVTRADFKALQVDPSRWIYTGRWLSNGAVRGQYVRTIYTPDFKAQHPRNYVEIEADFEKWEPKNA